jgi:hypothetical protein
LVWYINNRCFVLLKLRYIDSNLVVLLPCNWQPRLYVGRGMHESTFSLFK